MKRLITPENNVKLALELRRGRWLVHDISTLIPTAISLLQQQDILLQCLSVIDEICICAD
jgi:DNA polymerase/3'-5' exonuclease PolX